MRYEKLQLKPEVNSFLREGPISLLNSSHMHQLDHKINWSVTWFKSTKSLPIHAKCTLPELASLSPHPYNTLSTSPEWSWSVSSDSSFSWQTSRSFPLHRLTRPGWLHTLTSFCLAYWDIKLQGYCPKKNLFTCDLAPGVIGTLKLLKSQMKISESLAPEAKRLLCRKKRNAQLSFTGKEDRFLKNKCKQKTQKLPKWGESCISQPLVSRKLLTGL